MGDGAAVLVAGNLFRIRTDVAFRSTHYPMDGLVHVRLSDYVRRPTVEDGVLDHARRPKFLKKEIFSVVLGLNHR